MLTATERSPAPDAVDRHEQYYLASQWQLMWRKFRRHKMAIIGGGAIALMYLAALFCGFLSPHNPQQRLPKLQNHGPQAVRFIDGEGRFHLRPFVYGIASEQDPETWEPIYVEEIALFVSAMLAMS